MACQDEVQGFVVYDDDDFNHTELTTHHKVWLRNVKLLGTSENYVDAISRTDKAGVITFTWEEIRGQVTTSQSDSRVMLITDLPKLPDSKKSAFVPTEHNGRKCIGLLEIDSSKDIPLSVHIDYYGKVILTQNDIITISSSVQSWITDSL
jgi:hypothetical protein